MYCCGPGDDSPVPETVDDVHPDPAACESIREHVMSISPLLRASTVDKRQACFLPVASSGGGPIVGPADHIAKGLVIATGHTCWVRVDVSAFSHLFHILSFDRGSELRPSVAVFQLGEYRGRAKNILDG